ncbi:MAG TPA: hypothetical protein VGO00_09245 [Kofleriaceae bacterium]|nr:hypothetical protein [Kofleriaceae bacterium]
MSAYIAEAVEQYGKQEDLAAVLDDMLAETGGSLTDAERRAADRVLAARAGKHTIVTSDPDDLARLDPRIPLIRV